MLRNCHILYHVSRSKAPVQFRIFGHLIFGFVSNFVIRASDFGFIRVRNEAIFIVKHHVEVYFDVTVESARRPVDISASLV